MASNGGTSEDESLQMCAQMLDRTQQLLQRLLESRELTNPTSRCVPYSGNVRRVASRSATGSRATQRTWTHTFVCLQKRDSDCAPGITERARLARMGLGEKKITFPVNANSQLVKERLFEAFPSLSYSGFVLLILQEGSRTMLELLVAGCTSVDELKGVTGRIYIRPIQHDLPGTSTSSVSEELEECSRCDELIAALRQHQLHCCPSQTESDERDTDEDLICAGSNASEDESLQMCAQMLDRTQQLLQRLLESRELTNPTPRFVPYSGNVRPVASRSATGSRATQRTWTHTFVCLQKRDSVDAPGITERARLARMGLGEKKITFPVNANPQLVKERLFEAFPSLSYSGFVLLILQEGSRTMLELLVAGCTSVDELKGVTGRIYIRPIQHDLPGTSTSSVSEELEECSRCDELIAALRQHQLHCCPSQTENNEIDTDEDLICAGSNASEDESLQMCAQMLDRTQQLLQRLLESRELTNPTPRFVPYSGNVRPVASRSATGSRATQRTWTHTFVCLQKRDSVDAPGITERARLARMGLGEKKITFPVNANPQLVKERLFEAFPSLSYSGGFELLILQEGCRTILGLLVAGCTSVEEMKATAGTERIYIRPIQHDLPGTSTSPVSEEREECSRCDELIAVNFLRQHLLHCCPSQTESNEIDTDEELPSITAATNSYVNPVAETSNPVTNHVAPVESSSPVAGVSSISPTLNTEVSPEPETSRFLLQELQEKFWGKPVTEVFNYPLEASQKQCIHIRRDYIYADAMRELLDEDFCHHLPLEVKFLGELADDYSGPFREFMCLMLGALRSKLFVEHNSSVKFVEDLELDNFRLMGIIIGLSLMQNGPLPHLFSEDNLQCLVSSGTKSPQIESILLGLGPYHEFVNALKTHDCLKSLVLLNSTRCVTHQEFMTWFLVDYSERGSNRRQMEDNTFTHFIEYVRDCARGKRGSIGVGTILQVVTGSTEPPLLGFSPHPKIQFEECPGDLPRAQTCSNILILPRTGTNDKAYIFAKFDLAFLNTYFGLA